MVNQQKKIMMTAALLLLFLTNVQSEASFTELSGMDWGQREGKIQLDFEPENDRRWNEQQTNEYLVERIEKLTQDMASQQQQFNQQIDFMMGKLEKLETENQRLQSIINKQQEQMQQFTTTTEAHQNVEKFQIAIKDLYQQMEELNNQVTSSNSGKPIHPHHVHPNASEVIGFSAYTAEDLEYTPGLTVLFQQVEYNSGATYNPEISVFYCNVPGLYFFSVSVLFQLLSTNNYWGEIELSVEDRVVGIIYARENSDGFRYKMASKSIITTCGAGGIAFVRARQDSLIYRGRHSTFTGFLLAAA